MKEEFRRVFLYFDQNLYLLTLIQVFLGIGGSTLSYGKYRLYKYVQYLRRLGCVYDCMFTAASARRAVATAAKFAATTGFNWIILVIGAQQRWLTHHRLIPRSVMLCNDIGHANESLHCCRINTTIRWLIVVIDLASARCCRLLYAPVPYCIGYQSTSYFISRNYRHSHSCYCLFNHPS